MHHTTQAEIARTVILTLAEIARTDILTLARIANAPYPMLLPQSADVRRSKRPYRMAPCTEIPRDGCWSNRHEMTLAEGILPPSVFTIHTSLCGMMLMEHCRGVACHVTHS